MSWQGIDREYLIFLPTSYISEGEIPLVVGLHGYTGTASGFEKETTKGMNLHAEYRNYIAVYPQGVNFWGKANGMPFLSAHGMIWKAMLRQEKEKGPFVLIQEVNTQDQKNAKNTAIVLGQDATTTLDLLRKL